MNDQQRDDMLAAALEAVQQLGAQVAVLTVQLSAREAQVKRLEEYIDGPDEGDGEA